MRLAEDLWRIVLRNKDCEKEKAMYKRIRMIGLATIIFFFAGLWLAHAGKKDNIIVQLRGTATGYGSEVPDIDGDGNDDEAMCFDMELVDPEKDKVIGTATDCLSNITEVGDGLALVGTTYFYFDKKKDSIVSRGLTTVQPKTHGSELITHITGALPSPGENSILFGTGKYKKASGSVRLSGAVDMSNIDNNQITFDCIFIIDLNDSDDDD
jgi:hypothetical protein